MAVPAMPGAGFVVIETEFVLGGFEAVLDGPAAAFDQHQLFHGRTPGAPGGEEGEIAVGNVAADQQTPRPLPRQGAVVFAGIEIGQFEIGPVMQARSFGSFACRQAPPSVLGKVLRDLGGGPADKLSLAPGTEHMIGGDAQNVAFARLAQHRFDVARAIHAVRRDEGERHSCGDRTGDHPARDPRLRRKAHLVRHMRRLQAVGIVRPFLRQIKRPVDEGMAVARHIGREHPDLAVGDLARRARVLARNPARRLARFRKPARSFGR